MKEIEIYEDYEVRFNRIDGHIYFEVYPISFWKSFKDDSEGYSYSAKDSSDDIEVFDKEKVRQMFEGSFCYRGVWESRVYFKDDEFWGEDLQPMSDCLNKFIIPLCRDELRKDYDFIISDNGDYLGNK